MNTAITDPYSLMNILAGVLWVNALAIVVVGVAETVSVKLGLSREPSVAIIVIVTIATVLKILAIGPAGPEVLQEPPGSMVIEAEENLRPPEARIDYPHYGSSGFVSPELFPHLVTTLVLSTIFLLVSLGVAMSRGEKLSSSLRFLFVSPFIFFFIQILGWIR